MDPRRRARVPVAMRTSAVGDATRATVACPLAPHAACVER
jgi:hypothetical protein